MMAPSIPPLREDGVALRKSQFPLVTLVWSVLLLCALYFPVLKIMAGEWFIDEDMGHAIFVPIVAGYVIWKTRDRIAAQPVKPNLWGFAFILWGFAQLIVGTLGAEFFVARSSFIVSLLGVVLVVAGTKVAKSMAFPFVLLLFSLRMPLFIYSKITLPLQMFASSVAASVLNLVGIPTLREGNVLTLPSQQLSVVEACSGIRSLISLTFLAVVYAYFFDHRVWMRTALLLAAIPITIVANAARVTITGILSEYNKELAQGIYHSFEGWVIFMVALGILILAHQGISRFYDAVQRHKAKEA
jgi:exosortase